MKMMEDFGFWIFLSVLAVCYTVLKLNGIEVR